MPVTLALATTLGLGLALVSSARADGMLFQHTIPREVDAYNFNTGGPFMAPPVPNGHYSKDYVDELHKHIGCAACQLHGLMGGVGQCFFHKGSGGHGAGIGTGCSLCGGKGCSSCSGTANGIGHGHGGIAYDAGQAGLAPQGGLSYGGYVNGNAYGAGAPSYVIGGGGDGTGSTSAGYATTWAQPSGQIGVVSSPQAICGQSGCKVSSKHSHLFNKIRCGSCGGSGCGSCAGTGATGLCGDPGCGLGAGHSHGGGNNAGTGCGLCGGRGCGSCLGGLKSKLAGGLGGLHGKLASLAGGLHGPKMQYFLGAGGPVPLTPGYVPYIVTTRSPRDFFSFPPMNPNDP
jgi:hypothetical protein